MTGAWARGAREVREARETSSDVCRLVGTCYDRQKLVVVCEGAWDLL